MYTSMSEEIESNRHGNFSRIWLGVEETTVTLHGGGIFNAIIVMGLLKESLDESSNEAGIEQPTLTNSYRR